MLSRNFSIHVCVWRQYRWFCPTVKHAKRRWNHQQLGMVQLGSLPGSSLQSMDPQLSNNRVELKKDFTPNITSSQWGWVKFHDRCAPFMLNRWWFVANRTSLKALSMAPIRHKSVVLWSQGNYCFLQRQDITKMDQTAISPDCNPIKHLWCTFGLAVSRMDNHCMFWVTCDMLCWINRVRYPQSTRNA